MSAYTTSTARDPRGTRSDPLRLVWSRQNVDGVVYDVLTCGHRYARTTEALPARESTVEVQNERRCPDCVT
ncbi:MAG TPA: hypothetical protein VD926_03685 [Acidimicrobiales bacterium]|nr:hypothetical protein [Acidimicrobiales bacterium]